MSAIDNFKITLIIMAFYSVAITLIAYAMPVDSRAYINQYAISGFDYQNLGEQLESSLQKQTNIPIIDLGALVFFSGNILIDLIMNFVYAIPQMISMLFKIFIVLFNLDNGLILITQTFSSIIITALYIVGLIQLLTAVRSGQSIL